MVSIPGNPSTPEQTQQCYTTLLGFAENFRTMVPPNIRLAVHCLKAVFYFKLPVELEAKTHLQLGKLLLKHSKSNDPIRYHLEKAKELGLRLKNSNDYIKYEASELLANFLDKIGRHDEAMCVLTEAMQLSNHSPYWHCRILFKLAHFRVTEGDYNSACEMLVLGTEFARIQNSDYTHGLFLLSKCMLLLASRQMSEVMEILPAARSLCETNNANPYQQESLRIFYYIIEVSYNLVCGRAKSAHPVLKQLHLSIQKLAKMGETQLPADGNDIERFQWMPREYMVILVYLITVMQAMQGGMLERAQRSADKALTQIEKLADLDSDPLLTVFHLNLLEHTAMGRLVMGVKCQALQDIAHVCRICRTHEGLAAKRRPQLHTLVGLYAMSMNCMLQAERQFSLALRLLTFPNALPSPAEAEGYGLLRVANLNNPLAVLICLNLALVYIRQGKTEECQFLLNRLYSVGEQALESCHCLKAAASYVRGFQAFYENRLADAKNLLRYTVQMSNDEELNRLSASALITLGQIHLNERNTHEGQKMISAAITVANRLPDIGIQLWATALLKDVANSQQDSREEIRWFTEHDRYSKAVIEDHQRAECAPEHRLIEWLDGPLPDLPSSHNVGSTSIF